MLCLCSNCLVMKDISRKQFIGHIGILGASLILFDSCDFAAGNKDRAIAGEGVVIESIKNGETVFSYMQRIKGKYDELLYRQIIGACNAFKEGDKTLGVAAADDRTRRDARTLLGNTTVGELDTQALYTDELYELIRKSTTNNEELGKWTMEKLKTFLLTSPEEDIKAIMPSLSSDVIGCVVKLMSNEELVQVGQKIFNPLPGSKIGSKGYLSARVQPNSPTDNTDDIVWQVFDAWCYAVGDLVLGTNPVSSEPESVARIEQALHDVITTFQLEDTIPNCVLSHIDIQAAVEKMQPGITGIWFQSLAGTVSANKTFDVTIDKMSGYATERDGRYGLYAETGQGADFTNGRAEGVDMVVLEARKYGFLRALKLQMAVGKPADKVPWVHVNDVAGFIGPEVFKTKEQLVRCCLEDTVMGKLHGLPIGLDICSTLHMDVTLEELEWCIEQVMPANPAYLMALPTKNDPMLGYLTTAFNDHIRVREKFGYKVNDAMWDFFKKLEIIDGEGAPTAHFGDPVWVYYKYRRAKADKRTREEIYAEGKEQIKEVRARGVQIAEGYGQHVWDMEPVLAKEVKQLYDDAKICLWTEMTTAFAAAIPAAVPIATRSADRKDYVYHPQSGEGLGDDAAGKLRRVRDGWGSNSVDVQIIISDGLNARALMDEGHLMPYLNQLRASLLGKGYSVSGENIVVTNGRVRAGYMCGELLFGADDRAAKRKGIIHIIGERPGSAHHNFSAYLTVAPTAVWGKKGTVDHNISRVVSGISDTAFKPQPAAVETVEIFDRMFSGVGVDMG
jgi:ethanolamine ammonia-lyase large subunit